MGIDLLHGDGDIRVHKARSVDHDHFDNITGTIVPLCRPEIRQYVSMWVWEGNARNDMHRELELELELELVLSADFGLPRT